MVLARGLGAFRFMLAETAWVHEGAVFNSGPSFSWFCALVLEMFKQVEEGTSL